jgi:hypothetical protein
MIKLFKTSKWVLTFMSITTLLFVASCGEEGDPEPEPIKPPTAFTYPATTVAVGATGTVTPSAVTGDAPIFTITDAGEAAGFVSINAATGVLSVVAESTTGTYSIKVKAANSAGSVEVTAEITIGVNADFNPAGKSYLWRYFMNQSDDVIFKNLDGLDAGLPPGDTPLAKGWPAGWPDISGYSEEELFPYLLLDGIQDMIFQVPGDDACSALAPAESQRGDTLLLVVNSDLTLSTKCRLDDSNDAGATVELGTSQISYSGGKYYWTLNMTFQGIPIPFVIGDPQSVASFIDPLLDGATYPALTGTVDQFTTPTNFESETTILTSLTQIKVDVVLQVLN